VRNKDEKKKRRKEIREKNMEKWEDDRE